jgi:hypothetical protein
VDPEATPNPNLPPRPVSSPNRDRHRITRVNQRTRARAANSVVESWVDMDGDVAAINRGEAARSGDTYLISGRTYRVKPDGKAFPVSGVGVHQLDRGGFRALGVYNVHGVTDFAEQILDAMSTAPAARAAGRAAHGAERGT